MLASMTSRQFSEWQAYLLIADSAEDPEPTRWDSDAMKQRKLDRKAERKAR